MSFGRFVKRKVGQAKVAAKAQYAQYKADSAHRREIHQKAYKEEEERQIRLKAKRQAKEKYKGSSNPFSNFAKEAKQPKGKKKGGCRPTKSMSGEVRQFQRGWI